MMKVLHFAAVLACAQAAVAAAACKKVTPIPDLNLTEWVRSTWYIQQQQITGYQQPKDLFCVSATYDLEHKKVPFFSGTVASVFNYATEDRVNGKPTNPDNKTVLCARVPDKSTPSKLLVAPCFLPNLLSGDYWVVAAGPSPARYEWAIISGGQPSVQYADGCATKETGTNGVGFWLFSRTPTASNATLAMLRKKANKELGLSLSRLHDVPQAGCNRDGAYIKPDDAAAAAAAKPQQQAHSLIVDDMDRYRVQPQPQQRQPQEVHALVFDDMHDGDQKKIAFHGDDMLDITITPHNNNETWVVHATIDPASWNATVDFRVPGKPNPPPIALTATVWEYQSSCAAGRNGRSLVEFSDPTGTIAPPSKPLNAWVEVGAAGVAGAGQQRDGGAVTAAAAAAAGTVFFDMHDGDEKAVQSSRLDDSLHIQPFGNDQTWHVDARWHHDGCTASVDFNVPGKPSPPPVNLTATAVVLAHANSPATKNVLVFTDPSGTIAPPTKPLNAWVSGGVAATY